MSTTIVFQRDSTWLPKAVCDGDELRLALVGGADALHSPRRFSIPLREDHLAVLRADLGRHLILSSALGPLCHAAGVRGPLDEDAAVALLDPILLAPPEEVDALLRRAPWERGALVAHGADLGLLESGRVVESMRAATETSDWQRARLDDADRRRGRAGVRLSPLDAAILWFTGHYLHGSSIPHRDAQAVDPKLLPDVLRVVATAEQACAGMTIARDPRRGKGGTDKQDWRRMEAAVEAAVRGAHPELVEDAVRTVGFLLCSEAAGSARRQPFDDAPDAGAARARTLTLSDDIGNQAMWSPGDARSAVETFWEFVAERFSSRNDVFTLEDEALGEGIQLHLGTDSIARVTTVSPGGEGVEAEMRVEYALVDDLSQYRALVRGYVAGGFDALGGLAQWMAHAEFEEARRGR